MESVRVRQWMAWKADAFLTPQGVGVYDRDRGGAMEPDRADEFRVRGEELMRKVREIIHEGNVRRIIIKDEKGVTYLEIPLTLGVVGALFLPVLAAVGALAALASNFTIELVRTDDGAAGGGSAGSTPAKPGSTERSEKAK